MDRRPKSVRYLSPKPTRRVNRTSTRVFSSAMNFDDYKKPSQRGFAINNRETNETHTCDSSGTRFGSVRSRFTSMRSHKPLTGSKSFHRKLSKNEIEIF